MISSLSIPALSSMGAAVLDRILYRQKIDETPLVLQQHRVYVLPTRRGWAVVVTLLLMLVTSMNYSLSLGYALTFLLAGLFGASMVHVYRNLVRLQVEPSGVPRAFAGEPLLFSFRVSNLSGYARRTIRFWSGQASAVIPTLGPGASTTVAVPCPTTTRGRRRLGRFTIITDFPLGLWRCWAVVRFDYEGVVYPRPETNPPALPLQGSTTQRSAASTLASLAQDVEIDGLRPYAPGDPLRAIAWKAVARGRGWYSKRFSGTSGPEWALLRWRDTGHGLDDEHRLSRLTSWVLRAERNCVPFALELPGQSIGPGQGHAHLDEALCALGSFGGRRSE